MNHRNPDSFASQVAAFVWARRNEHRRRSTVRVKDIVEVYGCTPAQAATTLWRLAHTEGRIACGAPGVYYAPRGMRPPEVP